MAALAFGLVAPVANAQVLYGSIVGAVTDESGAVIPAAAVGILNTGTGATLEAESSAEGVYRFTNVTAGTYDLTVTKDGFRAYIESGVTVTVNRAVRLDVALSVGQVTESIEVSAATLTLQTERTDVSAEIRPDEVVNMPLPRYRNYQSLINLVPGATPARFQNANTDSPARALTTNINGTNRNNNNTRIDGSTSVFIFLPHHTAYVAPAESIETVNISTNNFDAEQGMAGGAAITVVTKSGTNELHGSAFWFHDNGKTAAKDTFFIEDKRPVTQVNITGFTVGGPIVKDKLFFFGDWEGTRERVNRNRLFTIPTAAQRAGDFSSFNTTIFDPESGTDILGADRTPFPNNIIPKSRQAQPSLILQDLLPDPNQSGPTSNFFNSAGQSMNRDNFDVKINWNISDKSTFFGKYSIMDAQVTGQFGLGAAGGRCLCDGGNGTGDTLVQVATIGHTYTFSPSFLMDWTIGYTRMGQEVIPPGFGTNFGSDVFGIPGTNGPDPRQSGLPRFDISGYDSLGNVNGWSPIFRNDDSYTVSLNFSKLSGPHDIRFGFDGVRHHLNHWQPEIGGGPRGRIRYNGDVTGQIGHSENQFNGWASFLLGLPFNTQKSIQFEKMTAFEPQFAFYVRDRWQITPKLTATLGVRWEFYPLMTRSGRGGIEGFDERTGIVPLGGLGGNPKDLGVDTSKKLIGPRVGLAYRVNDGLVVRTGYGVTFNPMVLARPLRGFYPLTIAASFNSPNGFQPVNHISLGIPEIELPDVSSGNIPLPGPAQQRHITQGRLNRGYIQSWNFIIEKKLAGDMIGTIGYVGTRTVRSFADQNINAAPIGTGRGGQPFNNSIYDNKTTIVRAWNGYLGGHYHALQTSLNRRMAGGLTLKGQYTYSKAINQTDDDGWSGVNWNHPEVFDRNRARAGYDQTHVFTMGFVYDLPFGPGKQYLNSGPGRVILGDWQINGLYTAAAGRVDDVNASGSSLNAPGNAQFADQVSENANLDRSQRSADRWFNTDAFANVTDVRYGTSGRNILGMPGIHNMDFSVFRDFPVKEAMNVQLRAEFFNFTNSPHYNSPNRSVTSGNFGRVTSINGNARNRSVRFGLRLSF